MNSEDEHVGGHPKILKIVTFTVSNIAIKRYWVAHLCLRKNVLKCNHCKTNIRPMENIPTNWTVRFQNTLQSPYRFAQLRVRRNVLKCINDERSVVHWGNPPINKHVGDHPDVLQNINLIVFKNEI